MNAAKTGNPSKLAHRYDKVVKNGTAEEIPSHAVMKIVSTGLVSGDEVYTVGKSGGESGGKFLINGPQKITASGWGWATDSYPAIAAYDAGSPPAVPANGSLWGPFGSWKLSINGSGFLILGGPESGLVRVAQAPPGATAGADFPLILIRNDSGIKRNNRGLFGIGAPLNLPPDQLPIQPAFASTSPDAGRPWVVALNEVDPGNYVDAAPVGILSVLLNYRGQEYENPGLVHRFSDAIEGNYNNLASSQDGPARILWRERQGVSGSSTNGVQWAFILLDHQGSIDGPRGIITVPVTAATGIRGLPITPGKGKAMLYSPTGTGGVAGSPWSPGPIVDVETWMHAETATGKPVLLRPSRRLPDGHTIYELTAEGCKAVPLTPP